MKENLARLFYPSSVAVIGASNNFGKLGYHVMKSLIKGGFNGKIYPINPKTDKVWEIKTYTSLEKIKGKVEVAIIVVPASLVPSILESCGKSGIKGVVLITAGFSEIEDEEGSKLQNQIKEIASRWSLPIIGPNTFGFVNLTHGLNATFTPEFSFLKKGKITLVSQSGGFSHLSGFMAMRERVGFSKIVGLGNRCNVDSPQMVEYLLEDPDTNVIALYIEGMDNPRTLFEIAKRSMGKKPIVAYKAGRSERSDDASKFHTGSLAGNYKIWQGALRQAGIFSVKDTEEFIDIVKVLEVSPRLKGNRIAVLSSQAGPGMIASDIIGIEGLTLARFSPVTQDTINEILPPLAIRTNPVDMGPAWYSPDAIVKILETVLMDEGVDGVLFLNMFASANINLAEGVRNYIEKMGVVKKPTIACFMAPPGIWDEEIEAMDNKKGMVFLPTPERAAKAMASLWEISQMFKAY